MTARNPVLLACLMLLGVAGAPAAGMAAEPRCTEGTWTIDGGPVVVGALPLHLIRVTDGVPFMTRACRAQRWSVRRAGGELRALFLCRDPGRRRSPRFPLRLRARLTDGCAHMAGAFALRRSGALVPFTATMTGSPCASNDDCTAEAFCARPLGACSVQEGRCEARAFDCFGLQKLVCGCDGRTWGSCDAVAAGVSIADDDPCPGSCGGPAELPCPEGQFCDPSPGECGIFSPDGRCVTPTDACPEFYSPVCGCDGVTYANDCFRQAARAPKAHDGPCGGCTSLLDCPPNEFCQSPEGHCGVVAGTCTFIEQVCSGEYEPVCGCDGQTYANRCGAAMRAVSVHHAGACDGVCGGIAGTPCPAEEFCELPAGACDTADLQGRCVPASKVCPQSYAPVCGCDGGTYENDCARRAAGAQKAHDGPCECVPRTAPCTSTCDCYRLLGTAFCDDCPLLCPSCGDYWQCKDGACVEQCGILPTDARSCVGTACGGVAGTPCPPGQSCDLPFGFCGSDVMGQCVPYMACTLEFTPVCGCDGKTYPNDCARRNAGVHKAHDGSC